MFSLFAFLFLGYEQLVLNTWRFHDVYERSMSTSRVNDVFVSFCEENLSSGKRSKPIGVSCCRCKQSVDKYDHYFVSSENKKVSFCNNCARLERFQSSSLETLEIPFDLKHNVETTSDMCANFVCDWIEYNLLKDLGRKMTNRSKPVFLHFFCFFNLCHFLQSL
jgi:hypothetical protein